MSQAQKASEPGMEDLLASIRKAINEDSAPKPGGAGAPGISGSMRELRVHLDDRTRPPGERPQSEILELRNRIAGQLAERTPNQPASKSSGFAGILSGDVGLPAPLQGSARTKTEERQPMMQAPSLRQGYSESENEAVDSAPSPDEPRYSDDRDRGDDPGEDHDPQSYRRGRAIRESAYPPPSLPESHRHGSSAQRGAGMMSPEASASAESAFSRLADSLISRATSERSIEDITRELLRPMLKQWLDEHLPTLVERLVREEIERVARRGGR
jgi:cell pole-organizing protein PopZ